MREFEGPLCTAHGPYLMQEFPELDDLYKRDEEVVVWNTFDELKSKISALLHDEKTGAKIAERGRHAVLSKHLWSHRVLEIMSYRRS